MENIDIAELVQNYVIPWGIKLLLALAIFYIGRMVVAAVVGFVRKVLEGRGMDAILVSFLVAILRWILLLFVVIAALSQLGINTNSLVAVLGAAGLAIGLSLQSSLSNFASGVMLIIFRPFTIDDFIEAGGVSGVVEEIGIFSITLRTADNRGIIIPNGSVYGGTITNYSRYNTRRVDMVFGIGYDDNLLQAKEIIKRILSEDERILADPAPTITVGELADSSVNFNVRPWCATADYWGVYGDVHEKIKLTFDAEGISIPYPQMDIHQDKVA